MCDPEGRGGGGKGVEGGERSLPRLREDSRGKSSSPYSPSQTWNLESKLQKRDNRRAVFHQNRPL